MTTLIAAALGWSPNTSLMSSIGLSDGTRRPATIQNVRVTGIDVGQRERPLDQATVERIAESFRNEGQLQPIGIKRCGPGKQYRLIYGHHRLAASLLMYKQDPTQDAITAAIFREDLSDADCRRYEVVENLVRKELNAQEREAHTALYLGLTKQAGKVTDADKARSETQKTRDANGLRHVPTATQQVAKDLGISQTTVRNRVSNAVKIAERAGVKVEGAKTPEKMSADDLVKIGEAAARQAAAERAAGKTTPHQPSSPTEATVRLDTNDVEPFIKWCRTRISGKHKPMSLDTLRAYRTALDQLIAEIEAKP